SRLLLTVSGPDEEPGMMIRWVRWHAVALQSFFDTVVPDTHLAELAGLFSSCHLAAKGLANSHHAFDLLDGGFAFAVRTPEVVLVADAHVLAQDNGHRGVRDQPAHTGPEGIDGTLRHA